MTDTAIAKTLLPDETLLWLRERGEAKASPGELAEAFGWPRQ